MDSYEFDETQKRFIEQSVIPYAVYLFVDRRVVTLAVSNGLCELLGLSRNDAIDLLNNDMYRYTHPDDLARVADLGYQFAVGGEVYDAVYRTKSRNGKYVIFHSHGRNVRAKDGTPLAFIWYMTEPLNARKKIEAERQLGAGLGNIMRDENMFHRNFFDTLTGLPNMTHFFSIAQEASEKAHKNNIVPKMLFFDLSGMKSFNGKYGYSEGDKLIREVSIVLKNQYTSDFCGRLDKDPAPALRDLDCWRTKSAMTMSRLDASFINISGKTFSIDGDGSLVESISEFLYSYLGLIPVALSSLDKDKAERVRSWFSDRGIDVEDSV